MFSFAEPYWLFLIIVPFIVRLLPKVNQSNQVALYLPTFAQLQDSNNKEVVRRFPWMWLLVWILLVAAIARPQWLGEPITIAQEGREFIVAVDLSGSMEYEDMYIGKQKVNRLAMLKHVLSDFIERRVGDRIGLILFADTAYVQTPLTYDRTTVQTMLDEAVLGLIGDKTAIGDALGLAAKRFSEKEDSNRIVILLTDGQNTAGNIAPQEALEIAKAADVKVYTIGIGADEMYVRSFLGTRRVNPAADLDETLLNQIATETNGQYFRARDTESLEQIYQILDQLEPIEDDPIQLRPMQALFYYPASIAFVLSLLLVLVPMLSTLVRQLSLPLLTKGRTND